jgi:putative transposon-encoded protein
MDELKDDFGAGAMCRCPKDTILDRKVLLSRFA